MRRRLNLCAPLAILMFMATSLACSMGDTAITPTSAPSSSSSVVFIAPENNSVIAESSTIEFAVHASDSEAGITKIDFFVDDNPIGSQSAPSPQSSFTAHQTWTAKGVQGHFLSAVASRADTTKIGDAKVSIRVVSAAVIQPTATQTPTIAPTTTPTLVPTKAAVQATTSSSSDATNIEPSATSEQPTIQVTSPSLNIRAGDGTVFSVIGVMQTGDVATILGQDLSRKWWIVQKDTVRGWVINDANLLKVVGDTSNVPFVASPPTPIPTATTVPTLAPTSTVGNYPDLVIDTVSLNPSTPTNNQTFIVTVVVRNAGTLDAGTSLLSGVFQPGNERSNTAVPAIKAGQSVTVTLPVTLHSSGANQTGTVTADANNDIAEGPTGEANNAKTITYNVN